MSSASMPIKVAVIEGYHPYEVPQWHAMFRSLPGIDYYPQTIENWAFDFAKCRRDYDMLLFYNMNMNIEESPFKDQIKWCLENEIGESGQGLFVLHHALLAYPDNKVWSDMVGIADRRFGFHGEQRYTLKVANQEHPISQGMKDWPMFDETYTMNIPGADSTPLFTVEGHEKCMDVVGWTRQYKKSRVFCFQPGHDHFAWEDMNYREVMLRGIRWCAGRL